MAVFRVVAGLGLLFLAFLGFAPNAGEASHMNGMDAMSIDVNTSGNSAANLGPNNTCISANPGASITVDITARQIPITDPMVAFSYYLNYNPAVFTVESAGTGFLLAARPGSSVFPAGESLPDSDGTYMASAADLGDPEQGEPDVNSAAETGSGVLARLTLDIGAGVAPGSYDLTLSNTGHVNIQNQSRTPDVLNDASVSVGQACPWNYTGDVDCSLSINSVDALKVLRYNAGLPVTYPAPCVDIGADGGTGRLQGDVDCAGTVNAVDALKILRAVAVLWVNQNPGCPDIIP
jgi:hypothetical protein